MNRNLFMWSAAAATLGAWACVLAANDTAKETSMPQTQPAASSQAVGIDPKPAVRKLLTYVIHRPKAPIKIDADWNKAVWKDVPAVTLEYYMGDKPAFAPRVQAKAAWDDKNIYIIWRVEDNYVLAKRAKHQEPVCLDSCAEFFFTPGEDWQQYGYYNLEMSATGVMWLSAHPAGKPAVMLPADDLATVEIASSLKGPIAKEIVAPTVWTLEYRLPIETMAKHSNGKFLRPAKGVTWRANFYKCADETSRPHWLTWSPIVWKAPAFHIPRQFGILKFED
ncbi:MAG: carbohydrate-binding family 9-like protein [Planctomycetaceae bacterium]|nr:carbohydrate-binding family 9-like protein [Planctomycetaceae bacterium]